MRRTKHHIITYIPAPSPTYAVRTYLHQICEIAQHWSDEIVVTYIREHWRNMVVPEDVNAYGLYEDDWERQTAYSYILLEHKKPRGNTAVVGLEPTWLPSNPHVVREAVEFNPGKALYARRYFMVDARGYRADGIFAPITVIPVWPYVPTAHFTSEMDTAPTHAWTSANRGEAPFDILDMSRYGDEGFAAAGTIRMFEGTIAV